jgi:hypothetical protein
MKVREGNDWNTAKTWKEGLNPSAGDGDPWGLNPDLSVETKDNSIGEESRHSRLDYNRPGTPHLSDWYTNSRGRCDLVEHDNPATRVPVLQAIKELARTSRTSTELRDEYVTSWKHNKVGVLETGDGQFS